IHSRPHNRLHNHPDLAQVNNKNHEAHHNYLPIHIYNRRQRRVITVIAIFMAAREADIMRFGRPIRVLPM
ncbi:MAG: hypothetical protein AAAC47_14155, partial [Pararhizobium sp.]